MSFTVPGTTPSGQPNKHVNAINVASSPAYGNDSRTKSVGCGLFNRLSQREKSGNMRIHLRLFSVIAPTFPAGYS